MPELKTSPVHWLDVALWPLLKILWEPLSLKRSHWWHWRSISSSRINGYPFIKSKGGSKEKPRTGLWSNFWQTNIAWKKAIVLSPMIPGEYQIGYTSAKKTEICSIILDGPTALLKGSEDSKFFAISYPEGRPLHLLILTEGQDKKNITTHLI